MKTPIDGFDYLSRCFSFILEKGYRNENISFIQQFSIFISNLLEVNYVIVSDYSIENPKHTSTIVICKNGKILPNISYNLENTPCEKVIRKEICVFDRNVAQKFPKDKLLTEMGAESYIGTSLTGSWGEPIGLIAILDGKPIENPQIYKEILSIASLKIEKILETRYFENKINEDIKISSELIQHSEAKFKELSNLTFEGILIHNKGIAIDFNLSFEKLFGYERDELLGKDVIDIIIPKKYHNLIAKRIEMNYVEPYEIEGLKKDGSIFPIEIEARKIESINGERVRVAALRDITNRKKVQQQLKESEDRYKLLLESSEDMISLHDLDGTYLYFNGPSCYDIKKEDVIGKTPFDFFESRNAEKIVRYINEVGRTGKSKVVELELNWLNEKKWFSEYFYKISDDEGKPQVVKVCRDIDEKKRIEQENFKLSTVVEQSANSIFITDINGIIQYINPSFSNVMGYNKEDVIGKNPNVFNSGLHTTEFYKNLWNTILSGETWKGEIQNRTKKGNLIWERSTISPIKDNKGEIVNFLSIKEDVTKIKEAYSSLKKALVKARESDKLKSAFIANVSHEIRTPMNGIIGFSEFLLDENLTNEKREKYAKIIISSSKHLLEIVNDILDISKIEAGVVQLKYSKVNLNKILDKLYNFYLPKARQKNIKLTLHKGLDNNRCVLETDALRLTQILKNLLSNAFKFTFEGAIEFGYELEDKKIMFYVKDSGKGIEEEIQHRIFERFFQEKNGMENSVGGTGLGLSIAKNLVNLLKGDIWFKSNPKGTSMFFSIPYLRKESIINTYFDQSNYETSLVLTEKCILIADDEEFNRVYLNEVLNDAGYCVVEASNGEDAINKFKEHANIDLILMDIKMPVMNGIEAMKKLKFEKPEVPIIAVSAFAMESEMAKAIKLGFDHFISKPINRNELLSTIQKYLIHA